MCKVPLKRENGSCAVHERLIADSLGQQLPLPSPTIDGSHPKNPRPMNSRSSSST